MAKETKKVVAEATETPAVVNAAEATPVIETFEKRCVAIKQPGFKTYKVVCEDGMSVSVPPAYREAMTPGEIITLTLTWAAGRKFYKAVGLNAPKKSSRKATLNAGVKAAMEIFAAADSGTDKPAETPSVEA